MKIAFEGETIKPTEEVLLLFDIIINLLINIRPNQRKQPTIKPSLTQFFLMKYIRKQQKISLQDKGMLSIYSHKLINCNLFYRGKFKLKYILILLMLIEASVLEQISTKNIIKFTISESQLENNFELILKALRSHNTHLSNLEGRLGNLESQSNKKEGQKSNRDKEKDQSQSILNSLQEKLENLQRNQTGLNEKTSMISSQQKDMQDKIIDLIQKSKKAEKNIESLKQRASQIQGNSKILSQKIQIHDKYEQRIKNLQNDQKKNLERLENISQALQKQMKSQKKQDDGGSKLFDNLNKRIEEINDKLDQKIQSNIKNTQSEFQLERKSIQQLKKQISKLNIGHQDQVKTSKKLSTDIWKLNDELYKYQKQKAQPNEKSSVKGGNSYDETDMKKTIAQQSKKLSHLEQLLSKHLNEHGYKTNYSALKTQIPEFSPSPRKEVMERQFSKDLNTLKEQSFNDEKSNFRKQIIEKLKQQKGDVNKALKKIDSISLKKDQNIQKMQNLEDKVLQVQRHMQDKVDNDGLKKWMKYVENKINYIYRIVEVQANQQDACVARKNWMCLSCDKNLDTYRGKVGNHLINAQLKGKTLDNDVLGGGMLFRSKSKYQMPQLKK